MTNDMNYEVIESSAIGSTRHHIDRFGDTEGAPFPRRFRAKVRYTLPGDDTIHEAKGIITETLDEDGMHVQDFDGEPTCGPHDSEMHHEVEVIDSAA